MKILNIASYLIEERLSIKDALNLIDKNKKRFLLVVNKKEILLGTLTDGDIRRAFLNGFSLKDNIFNIIKKEFV